MIMAALALVTIATGPDYEGVRRATEPARRQIALFCHQERGCMRRQSTEMAYFFNMMVAFRDPGNRAAERCMREGKRGLHIDWTVAAPCMRRFVRGKPIGA